MQLVSALFPRSSAEATLEDDWIHECLEKSTTAIIPA